MGAATSGMQAQMQQEHDPNAAFPWWVRFLAKALGVLGGFIAIFFAVLGLISFSATCIIAVLLQLAFGVLIVALEAPFCCMFIDFIEKIAIFSESRKYWHKAALYCVMGLMPIMMCMELNTILGGGMIFASGTAYGFMALGRKADLSSLGGATDPAWNANVGQFQTPASFASFWQLVQFVHFPNFLHLGFRRIAFRFICIFGRGISSVFAFYHQHSTTLIRRLTLV